MTIQVVDSENVVESIESAPDKLRAEIGAYYKQTSNAATDELTLPVLQSFSSGRIKSSTITTEPDNDQLLIPIKRSKILIEGEESFFRDHIQWNDYISQLINEGRQFLDHTLSLTLPTVTNKFMKNFHHPQYEDSTKFYSSNQLLNYNLISYPWNSNKVKDIGYIRTEFDQISTDDMEVSMLMDQFQNRITNYTGSATERLVKQRHIFDLDTNRNNKVKEDFPYYYEKQFSNRVFESYRGSPTFPINLKFYGKFKNLFQSIKKDLSFSNRSFNVNANVVQAKIYNAITILTSTSLTRFNESSDELFLLPEADVNHSSLSERFVNQLNAVKFLADMRSQINQSSRTIEQIFDNQNCEHFLLGYKIEKYLENYATWPIQTYYTIQNNFFDTQLKYGSKYIYKTKVLIGIFGSSYSYSNLKAAQSAFDQDSPTSEKYWATVDVEVRPSFQILEFEIDVHETAFIDTPMLTPHVTTYGGKDKPMVNFLFQPRFFTLGNFGQVDPPPVGKLRPSDERISNLYNLSGDLRALPDYFTGIYEIYRLDKPPESKEDFKDGFLSEVNQSVLIGNPKKNLSTEEVSIDYATFSDRIVPNKKYYYAFRTLTYHRTPSQLTDPIEVELQQDSDEYKILAKHYHYRNPKDYTYEKTAKRLIRIVPNIERLLFSEEVDRNTWQLDSGKLVSTVNNTGKVFKIRITSKHTGKKIDLNVRFKLNKDDTFYQRQ